MDRNYMIVDEVSMMDTNVIVNISTELGHAKSVPSEKFGGVNVIFMGDFLQLPAVSSRDLYVDNAKTRTGHDIWRSLNVVMILRHQIRQAGDPHYTQLSCGSISPPMRTSIYSIPEWVSLFPPI